MGGERLTKENMLNVFDTRSLCEKGADETKMKCCCFRPLFCIVKAELGRGQASTNYVEFCFETCPTAVSIARSSNQHATAGPQRPYSIFSIT